MTWDGDQYGIFYEPFFLRAAQDLFIADDSRLLSFGVMPPRLFVLTAACY
jgi:hypothetical protein